MLAAGPDFLLRQRGLERVDQHGTCAARFDHLVHVAPLRGGVRIREALAVVVDQLLATRFGVVCRFELFAEDDVHRTLRTHHRDFGRRPREVEVRSDVLGAHDVVGATVGLPRDHRQFRHGRFRKCVQELRAVANDPAPLLLRPR